MKIKTTIYILVLFVATLSMSSCKEGFGTWRELNEEWIAQKVSTLGTPAEDDPEIIETRTLPTGVMMEIYHNGFGAIPKPSIDPDTERSSTIIVNYRGYLIDGTIFNDGKELSFSLGNTIQGWQDALSQLRQGSSCRIYIPYSEGYDKEGTKDGYDNFVVPPYSTLIFDIDLLDVINY